MSEAIRVMGLSKSYNGKRVLNGLNFSVKRGTVFGLLGANGAGKSTTIECILGTKKADSGEISVLGCVPGRERRQLFEKVGVQFQEGDYQPEIKVCELCEETACLYRNPAEWKQLLIRFGIGDKEKSTVKSLSGGERQRVKLAKDLYQKGNIYVLDEPTTGLHTADVHRLVNVLNMLVDAGNTVLVIEHNLDVIKTADYIIDLGPEGGKGGGTIVATGTPEEIAECDISYTGQYLKKYLNV